MVDFYTDTWIKLDFWLHIGTTAVFVIIAIALAAALAYGYYIRERYRKMENKLALLMTVYPAVPLYVLLPSVFRRGEFTPYNDIDRLVKQLFATLEAAVDNNGYLRDDYVDGAITPQFQWLGIKIREKRLRDERNTRTLFGAIIEKPRMRQETEVSQRADANMEDTLFGTRNYPTIEMPEPDQIGQPLLATNV